MSPTPSDATRFTSTGPYASSQFSSNPPSYGAAASFGTRIDFGTAPAGETPQQKIARLRAAAARAKQVKETPFDKTVRIGRVWADRAHRVTTFSLIGLTIISGVVATAGITDMMIHNRRKRKEWLAAKQAETARDLAIAKQAEAAGSATEDQILLINRERAAMEAEIARQNRPGVFKRASNWLFSDLTKGGRLGAAAVATGSAVHNEAQGGKSVSQAVKEQVDERRKQAAETIERTFQETFPPPGGPLDTEAQLAANSASDATRSWTSWITGK